MRLEALFRHIQVLEKIHWEPHKAIQKVTSDSRAVEAGDVFVACRGSRMDGHDFIGQAIMARASVIVYEELPEIIIPKHVTAVRVANSQGCLAELLNLKYGFPDRNVNLVGVTGTNGKTTVSYLLHRCLSEKQKTAYLGTLWYELPSRREIALNTTPGAEVLIPLLADMNRMDVRTCVLEVSSHALKQHRVHGLEFELAMFTQLTSEHLDYHKNLENYFQAKRSFFHGAHPPRKSLINRDCIYGRRLLQELPAAKTFGMHAEADYRIEDLHSSFQGSRFTLCFGSRRISFQIRLPMRHNAMNVAAVLASLDMLGHDPEDFKGLLQEIPGIPGRMERVTGAHDFDVFVDYAHTPDAFENVLHEARALAPRRILTLYGCGGDRDRSKRAEMTRIACKYSDVAVMTTDNPRSEDPEAILKEMRKGICHPGEQALQVFEVLDRREAIEKTLSLAEPGDVVFILGKGHEDYQILGEKKVPFDDRLVAQECLKRAKRVFLS